MPVSPLDANLAGADYCYITTTGRRTGKPHTVEIWFGIAESTLYILAGSGERADFVRNARKSPDIGVRIAERTFTGRARIVATGDEDALARRLLLAKYRPRSDGDLDEWGITALVFAVDLA